MLSTKEKIQLYNELINIIKNSQLPIDTRYLINTAYFILKKKSIRLTNIISVVCWRLSKQPPRITSR